MDISRIALILWIPISLIAMNSLGPGRGAVITIIGASLFLPNMVGFDFPLVPPLGKQEIATIAALVGAALYLASPSSTFTTGTTIRVDGGSP